jgi:gliding motility-associated-like protein
MNRTKIIYTLACTIYTLLSINITAYGQFEDIKVDFNPTKSFLSTHPEYFHGDYIYIGNTNTKLISTDNPDSPNEEVENIMHIGGDGATIFNSSSASFCFEIKDWCKSDSIAFAQLIWCGKSRSADKDKVKWQLNEKGYNEVSGTLRTINGATDERTGENFYSCVADITKELQKILFIDDPNNAIKNKEITFTVANIQTELTEGNNKFSGWNLLIIYKQKENKLRDIYVYNDAVFGAAGQYPFVGNKIEINYDLPNSYTGIGNYMISMTTAGGFKNNIDNETFYAEKTKPFKTIGLFSNSITISSDDTLNCEIYNEKEYSRGIDIHTINIPNVQTTPRKNWSFINKGLKNIYLEIPGENEHHYVLNTVISTNTPKNPEIEAVLEANNGSKPSCINYSIDINTGDNVERLNEFKIEIQLPDYTTSVSNFNIISNFSLDNPKIDLISKSKHYIGINTDKSYSTSQTNSDGWIKIPNDNNKLNNTELTELNNQLRKSVGEHPTLKIQYADTISNYLKNQRIFRFEYEVCVDSSYYALNSMMTGKKPEIISQADLSVVGDITQKKNKSFSNDKESLLGKLNPCEEYYDLGSGEDFGGSGGNNDDTPDGDGMRNGKPTSINIDIEVGCPELPQEVEILTCADSCFSIDSIKSVLKKMSNNKFDLDTIVKREKEMWKKIKRDSLIKICQLAIPTKTLTLNNTVYVDSSNWYLMHKYWHKFDNVKNYSENDSLDLLRFFVDTCGLDAYTVTHKILTRIRPIIEIPEDTTYLDYKLNSTNSDWIDSNGNFCVPAKDTTYHIDLVCPYKNTLPATSSCSGPIDVAVKVIEVPQPIIKRGEEELKSGGTIQYCLDDKVSSLSVIKTTSTNNILLDSMGTKIQEKGDTLYWLPNIKTHKEQLDSFYFSQETNGGCIGEPFKLYIEVLDVRVDETPTIMNDTIVCISDNLDSITVKLSDYIDVETKKKSGFNLRWYCIGNKDSIIAEKVDSIKLATDLVGEFKIGVVYYYQGCESDKAIFTLNVKPLPKKLLAPEISLCQYLTPDSTFIASNIIKQKDTDHIHWYSAKEANFTLEDTASLSSLLEKFDYSVAGKKEIVVAPISKFGCMGDTTLIPINIKNTDSTATRFYKDTIMLCEGIRPISLDSNIIKTGYENKHNWFWYQDKNTYLHNSLTGLVNNANKYDATPLYNTEFSMKKEYYVVRLDSLTMCASRPAKVTVIVSDSINSKPLIGDTAKNTPDYDNLLKIESYCINAPNYWQTLPFKASSDGLTIEYTKKQDLNDNCDSLWENKKKVLNKGGIPLPSEPGNALYCIREVTSNNCAGPWVDLRISARPSVEKEPLIDTFKICQFDKDVKLSEKDIKNNDGYMVYFFDADKKQIENPTLLNFNTDISGKFLSTLNNNFFYVSFYDGNKDCQSNLVAVDAIIHPKPSLPIIKDENKNLFFCADNQLITINDFADASINTAENNTKLLWSNETILTNTDQYTNVFVRQIDTTTQCLGDTININITIEKTFEFTPIDSITVCYNMHVDLWNTIEKNIHTNKQPLIKDAKPEFAIYPIIGNIQQPKLSQTEAQNIKSEVLPTQDQVRDFLVEIWEPKSRCIVTDSIHIRFKALPTLNKLENKTFCQYEEFDLPTPSSDYRYEWKNLDGTILKTWNNIALTGDNTFRLIATTKDDYQCQDSIDWNVKILEIPEVPIVFDTSFCQNTGRHNIDYKLQSTISNPESDLNLRWFKNGESIDYVNTDTLFSSNIIQETYTAVVTNINTQCFNNTDITVYTLQKISLNMEDVTPVCEPETINVANKISDYIKNAHLFGGNTPRLSSCFIIENGVEKQMNINDLSAIEFDVNNIEREFGYKMRDSKGVCTSSDTFKVTINPKPSIPTIEGGQDTLFYCIDDAPFTLTAQANGILKDVGLFWDNGIKGNVTPINEGNRTSIYRVNAIDTITQCSGEFAKIVAAIAPSIKTEPIQGKDTIELCAGETINLWDLAYNSFSHEGFYKSELIITQSFKNGNAISQTLLEQITSTQQDTSLYQFEITDPLSGCSALNKVVLIFHAKPTTKIDGETRICQNLDLRFNTVGDDRLINFEWKIDDKTVSTGNSYQQENLQKDFTISLTATLDELKSCSSVITKDIIVNPAPKELADTIYNICQTDKLVKINRNRTSEEIAQYAISWFNTDGSLHSQEEEIDVDLSQSRVLEYDVMLTNRATSCNGEKSRVTINIHPRIQFQWSDPDTICPPNEYNLLQNILTNISGGTHPKYQYTLLNGDTVRDENKIAQSGLYTVYFTDDNQCDASQDVKVQFFKRPEIPTLIAEDIVCQGIGDIQFSAKKNGEDVLNQTFEWKEGNQTSLSDQLSVSTEEYGIRNFILTAVDTLTQCRSEELNFKLDIREKIKFSPIEPLESCFDVPVDLTLATQNAYSGNDEEKILTYFTLNSNNSLSLINDPTQVLSSGKVIIKANESESGCYREDTIVVDIKQPLGIAADGTTTICEGEEIYDLTAINADRYSWVRQDGAKVESTLFPFGNSVTQSETFRLYGEKKIGNIFCMDSTDVEITVNLNPKRLADSSLVYCQTINGKEELNFLTDSRIGEILKIKWFTENNTELFSENELPSINTSNDSVYAIYAKQTNSTTGCESELATIKINILPQIEVPTIDSTTCQPNIINLEKVGTIGVSAKEYSKNIIIESIGVTNETDRSIVIPINNSTQISESGIYRIFYNYTLGDVTCRNTTDAKLTFLQQPQKPSIANQSFCQNTGEVELTGTPSYTNLRLIWEDLSVYPSRIDTNTTTVSTELATEKSIKVRHIQDNSGCISADSIIRVKILPELIAMDLDTSICYGESVNLREMVENNHRNNPLINNIQFKNLDAMQFDEKKVENTSLYQAYFSDASGLCRDTSLVQINVNNPVEITLEGANPSICAQEIIQITASGADNYKWNELNEGATFTLKTTTPQKMQINLRAKQAFKEIFCYKDSTISIEVMPAVEPLILTYDTCSKSKITTDLIKTKFNISENIDSIWYYNSAIRRDNISKVLEDEGNYQLLATNQYGCKAIHNMKVNMYNVGKLAIENDNSKIYCYNDTITFKATSENESKFTWKNSDNDSILYQGNNYWDSLKANTNLTLIASEVVMGCKDSISFTVNVREQTPIIVNVTSKKGETNVCKGDTIKLAVEGLNSVSWLYNDTIIDSNNLEIIGEKTTKIYAWGRDINNCQTNTEKVEINVATLFNPIIKTTNSSSEYDLSKEKTNIALYADGNTNNGQITYQWQIGNEIMHSSTMNSFSHTFSDETIHLNKDIEVNLYLKHEYGCKASASRILTIDPYLYVPNTLLYGHGIIFMEDYDLQIYDRVGTLIHEGKGWDGTYKGRPAIADTYFYSLMYYIKGEKQFKTGYITLVR